MNQNDNHHDDQNDKIKCDICEYLSGPMEKNYFDHFSEYPTVNVCKACVKEIEDQETIGSLDIDYVLEMLRNEFNKNEDICP